MRDHDHVPLLLCDLDDTLLDREATFRSWALRMAKQSECDDQGLVEWLVAEDGHGQRPRPELMASIKAQLGLPHAVEDLVEDFRVSFAAMFSCEQPVLDALRQARESGWAIGIVTNGSASQLRKVAGSSLNDYVDAVCVSEVEGCAKTRPAHLGRYGRTMFHGAGRRVDGGRQRVSGHRCRSRSWDWQRVATTRTTVEHLGLPTYCRG